MARNQNEVPQDDEEMEIEEPDGIEPYLPDETNENELRSFELHESAEVTIVGEQHAEQQELPWVDEPSMTVAIEPDGNCLYRLFIRIKTNKIFEINIY
jgi:hypothetical protein